MQRHVKRNIANVIIHGTGSVESEVGITSRKKKGRGWRLARPARCSPVPPEVLKSLLVVHAAAHAAHAAAMSAAAGGSLLLLRQLGDEAFGGQQ